MSRTRRVLVRALAKINLDLRVLHKRSDGYHELRTVFQTISLSDQIEIAFTPARRTSLRMAGGAGIQDNIILRAAGVCLDAMRSTGDVEFRLAKRIPMGGGLGGGSSDAAAVLLALPVLAGKRLELPELIGLAAGLGSDVGFFLLGGAALGLGRGEELYPLPDFGPLRGVLVAPGLNCSTREGYAALGRGLTTELEQNNIVSFESSAWTACGGLLRERFPLSGINDFEPWVFSKYPVLGTLKRKLQRLGAAPAMMSGSGSSVFGVFGTPEAASRALSVVREDVKKRRILRQDQLPDAVSPGVFPMMFVSRAAYRKLWQRSLRAHACGSQWPPLSRYAR